jgi:kumamolisin
VRSVGIDGVRNVAGQGFASDNELLLDVEVLGALAPRADLVLYQAPNNDRGFVDGIAIAVHATPTPTVLSISFGRSEDTWTAQARAAIDELCQDAAALGVTVCAAAGDNGSVDTHVDGHSHVDFPAASPHVLACGGTSVLLAPSGAPQTETVWNEKAAGGGVTGGGISTTFPLPDWQSQVGVPARPDGRGTGRGVPDVAALADPMTGYRVLIDGQVGFAGGTSAVAPLWAALVCRLAQALGRPVGLLQPALYTSAAQGTPTEGFRDISHGDNGAYNARVGWDPCTGLGVPVGSALLALLKERYSGRSTTT